MDITYIPMARGFVYLSAVVDWFSRRVLSWRISITMDVGFCLEAVEEALGRHGRPEIFNTDQGSQFTSVVFTGLLLNNEVAIPGGEPSTTRSARQSAPHQWHVNVYIFGSLRQGQGRPQDLDAANAIRCAKISHQIKLGHFFKI